MTAVRSATLVAALVCAGLAVWLAVSASDARRVERANELGAAGRFEEAIAEAGAVRREPAATRALLVRARALASSRRLPEAADAYARLVRLEPNDWVLHVEASGALQVVGRHREALALRRRARELNPRVVVPPGYGRAPR